MIDFAIRTLHHGIAPLCFISYQAKLNFVAIGVTWYKGHRSGVSFMAQKKKKLPDTPAPEALFIQVINLVWP